MRCLVPLLDFQFLFFVLWLDVSTFYALSYPVAFYLFPSTLHHFMISLNPISILLSWGFDLLCYIFAPLPSASQLDWMTIWHVVLILACPLGLVDGGSLVGALSLVQESRLLLHSPVRPLSSFCPDLTSTSTSSSCSRQCRSSH